MTPPLDSIKVTNFRSIGGTVRIPLDAPVVLIYGPNGMGKTSVMSAIELAMTGGAPRPRTRGFELPIASCSPGRRQQQGRSEHVRPRKERCLPVRH